jgi:AraC-like DNA-binding protein
MTELALSLVRGRAAPTIDPRTGLRRPGDHRRLIHESGATRILDISASHGAPPSGFSPTYQVVLPYLGVFAYSVGRRSTLIDTNRTLMTPANVDFVDSHPVRGMGHSAVVVAPASDVMDEMCRLLGSSPARVFNELSRPASASARLATHRLRTLADQGADPLESDEVAINILREVINAPVTGRAPSPRVVARAKQVIHERGLERISLDDVARAVGVSPVYLTQEFSRAEGVPLYRYQLQLRLSRALVELPDCGDITGLALDLGFASHSHFGAAFRRTFAITPAEFRAGARRRERL